jgi:hypothetical protein
LEREVVEGKEGRRWWKRPLFLLSFFTFFGSLSLPFSPIASRFLLFAMGRREGREDSCREGGNARGRLKMDGGVASSAAAAAAAAVLPTLTKNNN